MPSDHEMFLLSQAVEKKQPNNPYVKGVFAFIDGAMHKTQRPGSDLEQRRLYNGYYGVHGYKAVYCVQADGALCWARLGPGTMADNTVYQELDLELTLNDISPYNILGDSAFSKSEHLVRPETKQEISACTSAADVKEATVRNKHLSSIRIAAEWGVRDMRKFSIFSSLFPTDKDAALLMWSTVCHLHNVVCRLENINQTRNVFWADNIY